MTAKKNILVALFIASLCIASTFAEDIRQRSDRRPKL
jgi:hypothetical protein